jgi:hypothetical protein
MTQRQDRITNGCNLILKEISVQNRWGSKLATNLLTRLAGLCKAEVLNEPEEVEELIAIQTKLNDQS